MNKDEAIEKYAAASKLRSTDSEEKWREIFPDRESLIQFWEDTKELSWPENYGATPWELAGSVAAKMAHNLTQHSANFHVSEACLSEREWVRESGLAFLILLLNYGLSEESLVELEAAISSSYQSLSSGREYDAERERLGDLLALVEEALENSNS